MFLFESIAAGDLLHCAEKRRLHAATKSVSESGNVMETSHIVVGDGNPLPLQALKELLEPYYVVSTHADGRGVLGYLQDKPADLVLLDTELPDEDGFTVLEQIKADPRLQALPVILLSTLVDRQS